MLKAWISLLLLNLIFTTCINSKEVTKKEITTKVPLKSYYIPGLVDSPTSGLFIDVLRLIELESDIQFDVSIAPTKRVQLNFARGLTFGYFPELDENRPETGNCRSAAFMQKQIIAFVRQGETVINHISQLEGKIVGGVRGYGYGKDIVQNAKINLQLVKDDKTNIKKLLAHRIDVIIGDIHSTVNSLKETKNLNNVVFEKDKPVSKLDVFFLFRDDDRGLAVCNQVSSAIEVLRKRGELLERFGYQ